MVKSYLGKRIELEKKEAQADMKLIQSYREETDKKRKEIDELKTVYVVIVIVFYNFFKNTN